MKSLLPALGLAAALVAAGAAVSLIPRLDRGADAPAKPHGPELPPERRGHGHDGGAHPWAGGKGTIPDLAAALAKLERRSSIEIRGDEGFNPANGVRSGRGTFDDPFVIAGWYVDQVLIADTSKAFELKENYVADILILDWTGKGGYVHHNHVDNLRTNRNVARTGDPSATVIEHNAILRVEELRHFDGEVRNNTIGQPGLVGLLRNGVAFNIAGLNGAGIHDNVIHGGVDMKIHGHHHSDRTGAHSHNHGQPDAAQKEDHVEDHQVRYVDFTFYRNVIKDDGFGLRYNDLDHAGDDREATSEQEPDLEKPHVHHTSITLAENVIEGSTLRLVVVNSDDDLHLPGESAEVHVVKNRIVKPLAGDGLVLQRVKNAKVYVHENVVEKGDLQLTGTSAILLKEFRNSTITVVGNSLGAYKYGVRAESFDKDVRWVVDRNAGPGVKYPVYWDASVANAPEDAEGDDGHAHAHDEEHAHGSPAQAADARLFDVRNTALM